MSDQADDPRVAPIAVPSGLTPVHAPQPTEFQKPQQLNLYVTNEEFLRAAFGGAWWMVYVTGFPDDPSAIPQDRRGICWSGNHFSRSNGELDPSNNTYYCVSLFYNENGRAVRRRKNFMAGYVVMVDDVGTKIPWHVAATFPKPSCRIETSPGNEQWLYFMPYGEPEMVVWRFEGLVAGMVAKGLTTDGSDPGMKGVTRLCRLPEGVNNKAKYVEQLGEPWRCRVTHWAPDVRYSVDELAHLFGVELVAPESRGGPKGAGVWPDNTPVMQWVNENTLEDLGGGEYLVVCPWLEEHTDGDESGTWIKTNEDGSGEFCCHHGHCRDRGFNDFLVKLDIRGQHDAWRAFRDLPVGQVGQVEQAQSAQAGEEVDFLGARPAEVQVEPAAPRPRDLWQGSLDALPEDPTEDMDRFRAVVRAIAALEGLEGSRAVQALKARCRGYLRARDVDGAVAAARRELRGGGGAGLAGLPEDPNRVLEDLIYVESLHKYYRRRDDTLMSAPALDATLAHLEFWDDGGGPDGEPTRLTPTQAFDRRDNKRVASALGWQPTADDTFQLGSRVYANSYRAPSLVPQSGDVSAWLWLMEKLYKEYWWLVVGHMAFTVQHPDQKLRWQIFTHGKPRGGKTSSVYPLLRIFEGAAKSIRNNDLDGGWGDHFFQKKVLVIEEVLQPDNRDFYNDLKTRLVNSGVESLNLKGSGIVAQQNLYSMYLFSNYQDALHFDVDDEKLLVIEAADPFEGMDPEEKSKFFRDYYRWVDGPGAAYIYQYLLDYDVSEFPYGHLPVKTPAYYAAAREAMPEYQRRVIEIEESGEGVFGQSYFYFSALKAQLRSEGYKTWDRGLGRVLVGLGYQKLRGQKWVDGRNEKTPMIWSKDLIGKSPIEIYEAFHRGAGG